MVPEVVRPALSNASKLAFRGRGHIDPLTEQYPIGYCSVKRNRSGFLRYCRSYLQGERSNPGKLTIQFNDLVYLAIQGGFGLHYALSEQTFQ